MILVPSHRINILIDDRMVSRRTHTSHDPRRISLGVHLCIQRSASGRSAAVHACDTQPDLPVTREPYASRGLEATHLISSPGELSRHDLPCPEPWTDVDRFGVPDPVLREGSERLTLHLPLPYPALSLSRLSALSAPWR